VAARIIEGNHAGLPLRNSLRSPFLKKARGICKSIKQQSGPIESLFFEIEPPFVLTNHVTCVTF
jgi:hypothetical protein